MKPDQVRKTRTVKIETLTPIVVGNGQSLDPLKYIVRTDSENRGMLHRIDLDQWLEDHAEDKNLEKALEGRPLELRGILHEALSSKDQLELYTLNKWPVEDTELVRKFRNKLKDPNSKNQLLISEIQKNVLTGRLTLPGSSIKGALLTPIIDHVEREYKLGWQRLASVHRGQEKALKEVFGDITHSSFKALKVSDFEFSASAGIIVSALVSRLKNSESGHKNNDTEAISSAQKSSGTLTLGFDHKSKGVIPIEKYKTSLNWTQICQIVTEFYRSRFEEEYSQFYLQPWMAAVKNNLKPVRDRIGRIQPGNGEILLRIGHFSHSRCVTIQNSIPWGKDKNGIQLGPNTTRTLANGILPFGWVILKEVEQIEFQHHLNFLEQEFTERRQQDEQRRLSIELRKLEEEKERRQTELEIEKKRRQAEMEAKVEKERLETERQKELLRRENLGWKGRFIEDQDLERGQLVLDFLTKESLMIPGEGESTLTLEQLQKEKQELAKEILALWTERWLKPETYQKLWISRLKDYLGINEQSNRPSRKWKTKRKDLSRFVRAKENLESLEYEELKLLYEDVRSNLKGNEAKECLENIQKLIEEE